MSGELKEAEEAVERLLECDVWVVDPLPERVPPTSSMRYARVERHWLEGPARDRIFSSLAAILVRLSCYVEVTLVLDDRLIPDATPADIERTMTAVRDHDLAFANALIDDRVALAHLDHDRLGMDLFHPSRHLRHLIGALAASEGLFFWSAS